MDYRNTYAVVTGSGSGIGRATADLLARLGAGVFVLGHSLESAQAVVSRIRERGGTAWPLALEVGEPGSVRQVFEEIAGRVEHLDLVVANAGINGTWAPLDDLSVEEWQETISTNLTGTFLTLKYALPLLRAAERSAVVITASVNGTRVFSNSGASAYSASKAGQVALAKMAAVELASDRIRVNVVCPGSIETEIGDNTEQRHTDDLHRPVEFPEGQIPLSGDVPGRAADVAELICFLGSSSAAHITGTEVWIDGAQSLLLG